MSLSAANVIADPYHFIPGTAPILISIPHAGTHLTPEVASGLSDAALPLSDTDWHIPKLYDFARALGASILVGQYSRFVIDLNRPSDDKPLYTTATTGLYPDTLFDGRATFKPGMTPTDAQRQQYLDEIWQPYHQKIQSELARMKQEFGYALLFDAHSIASVIPRLFDGQLPDLNLGTNSGESCAPALSEILEKTCQQQTRFTHVLNGRFKGGYITRAYGQPENDVHAVQLELAQVNYMEEIEPFSYSEDKASELQALLKPLLAGMLAWGSERYKQGAV
ncbi:MULTISPECIES: N-formylglutamate deformylase [Rahnella]|uniref:N-formylglutamate deformylase n=1 Tax=Rahnella laticis TaxID=2787622 RepID=A0ABS0E799_9GAMM|nr:MULTISPECIES: N-formylglutamate deformylase [Rahnella]MBF7980964.1 N-formylglutamate deformylase [Rahnella laticis]MBF8001274.1 N-formylglutamate deformylase [Rahnella sp. LAC-M12]